MKKLLILWAVLLSTPLFAQSFNGITADVLMSMNTSTPGTALTPTIASAGTVLASTCTGCAYTSIASGITVGAYQNACSNLGPVTVAGTTYPTHSLNYNNVAHPDTTFNTISTWSFNGNNQTNVTVIVCFTLGMPGSSDGNDYDAIWLRDNTGSGPVIQLEDGCGGSSGLFGVNMEVVHPTLHAGCIRLTPYDGNPQHSSYWVVMNVNTTANTSQLWAYTANGTFLGTSSCNSGNTNCPSAGVSGPIIQMFASSNENGTDSNTTYYQNLMLEFGTNASQGFWTQNDTWTGVLAPARGTTWAGNVGVAGGIPSGSYSTCTNTACNTVTSAGTAVTPTQIQTAWSGAPANSCVILPSGTLTNVTSLSLTGNNNVCLRGAGANNTILNLTGQITVGSGGGFGSNLTTVVSGSDTLQGSNTVTLSSVANLTVGKAFYLDQLGNGNVGVTDNGGILEIGTGSTFTGTSTSPGSNGPYSEDGETNSIRVTGSCTSSNPSGCFWQQQSVVVTSCNGVTTIGASCSGTNVVVQFNPPLAMSNWNTALSMSAWWPTTQNQFVGLEDMQINCVNVSTNCVEYQNVNDAWFKGSTVTTSNQTHIDVNVGSRISIVNNYFWLTQNHTTGSYGVQSTSGYSFLVENNIFHGIASPVVFNGGAGECVVAYNYDINNYYTSGGAGYNQNFHGAHAAGDDMCMFEGNIANWIAGDNVHGTGNLNTFFRNLLSGPLGACWGSGTYPGSATFQACSNALNAVQLLAYHRFYNFIGNVWGTTGVNTTLYGTTANNAWVVGWTYGNGGPPTDANVQSTAHSWNNADSATGFTSPVTNCNNVVNASTYIAMPVPQQFGWQPCPTSNTLPASFYYTSKPTWWPTAKPWPPIGPDVTSGNVLTCTSGTYNRGLVTNASQCAGGSSATYDSGLVNSIPAFDCYITIGGDPYGSAGQLPFNEQTCYSNLGPVVTPNPPPAWIMSYFPFVDSNGHDYDIGSL